MELEIFGNVKLDLTHTWW